MPVDISIVIVNYNVEAFLQQCLYAVYNASIELKTEIFVVDNNSVDGSVEMVKKYFPEVNLIANKENKGFAFACNQAIIVSKGKYVLLLNPDTVIKEDSLSSCLKFMETTSDAGALGVKMINGNGKFLPESKRSLPTVKSAFFKMFGFSTLFPKSRFFGQYQLKYLDENQNHEVEVLSGAFMFIRKSVLDKIGLLDEAFFMYGEDIDLSYRIILAGYKNYYFSGTTIIHYKGESTKKASFKYVKTFYNAMLIFAKKHYKGQKQAIFRCLIRSAIYLRATMALLSRGINSIYLPLLDFLTVFFAYHFIVPTWENYKFSGFNAYSSNLLHLFIPTYILIWQFFIFYFTKYKLETNLVKLLKSVILGTVVILTIYSLLPENYRYSRALIIIGAFATFFLTYSNRLIIKLLKRKGKTPVFSSKSKALLFGSDKNDALKNYPDTFNKQFDVCKLFGYNNSQDSQLIINQLTENIKIHKIETIIFFIKDIPTSEIINIILKTADKNIEYKIILPESSSLVGSKSVMDIEKLPAFKLEPISKPINRLKKRVFDIAFSIFVLPFSPLLFMKNKPSFLFQIIGKILLNKLTWVSYVQTSNQENNNLPNLPNGVFQLEQKQHLSQHEVDQINEAYAKNYQVMKDIIVIFKALKSSISLNKHIKN